MEIKLSLRVEIQPNGIFSEAFNVLQTQIKHFGDSKAAREKNNNTRRPLKVAFQINNE